MRVVATFMAFNMKNYGVE